MKFSSHLAALIVFASPALLRAEPYAGKPYQGKPQEIPGIVQAEFYDVAPGNANGIAYHRNGEARPGSVRSTGDCIGLGIIGPDHVSTMGGKEANGGAYVGWTDVGDWWNYTVRVARDGTYDFGGKFAEGAKGAKISVTFTALDAAGGAVSTGPLDIPTTAGFQPGVEVYHVWETLDKLAPVKLATGLYIMTVKVEAAAGMNIDFYSLKAAQ